MFVQYWYQGAVIGDYKKVWQVSEEDVALAIDSLGALTGIQKLGACLDQ